jgi:hypothetical protein
MQDFVSLKEKSGLEQIRAFWERQRGQFDFKRHEEVLGARIRCKQGLQRGCAARQSG